jgi:hypothetical protein
MSFRVQTWLTSSFFADSRQAQEYTQLHELFHAVGHNSADSIPQLCTPARRLLLVLAQATAELMPVTGVAPAGLC